MLRQSLRLTSLATQTLFDMVTIQDFQWAWRPHIFSDKIGQHDLLSSLTLVVVVVVVASLSHATEALSAPRMATAHIYFLTKKPHLQRKPAVYCKLQCKYQDVQGIPNLLWSPWLCCSISYFKTLTSYLLWAIVSCYPCYNITFTVRIIILLFLKIPKHV